MHKEVATKEIMDFFRELAKVGIKLKTIKIMFESNTNNFLQSSKTGLALSCHLHQWNLYINYSLVIFIKEETP